MLISLITSFYAVAAKPCGGDEGSFEMKNIDFPDELLVGQKSWFTVEGYYPKKITSGKIVAKVYKGPFNLMTENSLLCEKTDCPLEGDHTIRNYIEVPAGTPALTYHLVVDISDQDDLRVGCFQVPMKVVNTE
eukprot:NODE_62_length_26495_cov_0.832853.p19 type:complete len:133 gc:universal NODE_62_length_26495_cov_0.832853:10334-10732(+)